MSDSKMLKRCYRLFLVWQEGAEERWLRQMAQQGWHLADVQLIQYTFVRGEPQDMIYRLDYRELKKGEEEEYRALFAAAGWEYVACVTYWRYWRTRPDNATQELYSDNRSLLTKYRRLLRILACSMSIYIPTLMNVFGRDRRGPLMDILRAVVLLVLVLLVASVISTWIKVDKLKRSLKE